MLENMTTGEKALIGATAIGIAALVFHKPTRNAVGLSDGKKKPRYDFLPHLTKKGKPKKTRTTNGKRGYGDYVLEAYRYGQWDIETRDSSLKEARETKKDYEKNVPGVKYRIRKES